MGRVVCRLDVGDVPYDVVTLLDLDMPGTSGFEVMDRLNEISPGIVKIVVTGNTSIDLEEEIIRKRRALSYLAKPFSPDQLKQVVRRALDSKAVGSEQ